MDQENIFKLCDLGKRWESHGKWVFRHISYALAPGQSWAIIGGSGEGKSTLLRCLGGLEPLTEGQVLLRGETLLSASSGKLASVQGRSLEIGMIFQEPHLFPHMTAQENVSYALHRVLGKVKAAAQTQARDFLAYVGMDKYACQYPATLSGGQRQRVSIARALAMEPKILLCDEPTSALDQENRHGIYELLGSMKQEGKILVIVTHDTELARIVADRTSQLKNGQLLEWHWAQS